MAHEIGMHDNVVLHKTEAWHKLGIVVENAPTPKEALKIAGLDWEVQQWPCSATDGESRIALHNTVANVRSDTKQSLGIVKTAYQPIQNADLADFCELLAKEGDAVKVESAGSIRNGQKVWFLLKGESFSVRGKDENVPYILVSNGHDGGTALRCTPTTVRVVCSNTLHMVIPNKFESEGTIQRIAGVNTAGYIAAHIGDPRKRLEAARNALGLYMTAVDDTREVIDSLAAREVGNVEVNRFLMEAYTRVFGPIPVNPETEADDRKREKALEAIASMIVRFESEIPVSGPNAWTALNAFTGWMQHKAPRIKDGVAARESMIANNLWGENAERAELALNIALSL